MSGTLASRAEQETIVGGTGELIAGVGALAARLVPCFETDGRNSGTVGEHIGLRTTRIGREGHLVFASTIEWKLGASRGHVNVAAATPVRALDGQRSRCR